ncbi:hypothetical protein ACHAXT_012162 [Thalassiosira profunda]
MTTRLQCLVAAAVVLHAYHRLSDDGFILRSFRGRGDSSSKGKRVAARKRPRPPVANSTTTYSLVATGEKVGTGAYTVGEFCPYCTFIGEFLCEDRLPFMMSRYKLNREEALKDATMRERCIAPPMPHKVYEDSEEPYVILHAGPHKTGTTALQAFIYDSKFANDTLFQLDNLRVPSFEELPGGFGKEGVGLNLPHCSIRHYKDGGGQLNRGQCDPMRKAFPKFLRESYNNSQNVLIVAEDFDQVGIDMKRMRFFLQPYKKIKVAVTYRRLHDWLPSFYNQIIDHYTELYAKGIGHFPSYVEWLEKNLDKFLQMHSTGVADRFSRYDVVESVEILNVHAIPNLIEHYFCNHLEAENVCRAIKEGAKPSKSNVGTEHEYERLAIEAGKRGEVPEKYKLQKPQHLDRAARQLQARAEEVEARGEALPRICPSDALLDKILAKQMEQERQYFPEWYAAQGGDAGLRGAFDKAVKKKFCSLDIEKIFERGLLEPMSTVFG